MFLQKNKKNILEDASLKLSLTLSFNNQKINQNIVKLNCPDETNITHLQDKMIFLLTNLKIYYVLNPNLTPIP